MKHPPRQLKICIPAVHHSSHLAQLRQSLAAALAVVALQAAAADPRHIQPHAGPLLGFSLPEWLTGDMLKALGAAASGVAVLGVLAYLYFREWRSQRNFEGYGRGSELRPISGDMGDRKPLLQTEKPPGMRNGQWMKRPAGDNGRGPQVILLERQAVPKTEPDPAFGVLTVQAEGEIDELYIDGEFVGMTPATLQLREGRHLVEVRGDACQPYRREIKVIAGGNMTLRVLLERELESSVPLHPNGYSRSPSPGNPPVTLVLPSA